LQADSEPGRSVVTGVVLRSLLTVVGYALGAFLVFALVVVLTELALADEW
jgi:hypothetical protein